MKKAAFAAIIGRPSAGKSTLMNQICGEKVAITSKVPQTTRNAIRGIVNREQGQLVFVDTPGRYKSHKKGNRALLRVSAWAVEDTDLILFVLDAARQQGAEDAEVAALVSRYAARLVVVINKIDAVAEDGCGPALEFLAQHLPAVPQERIFRTSAWKNEGIQPLLDALFALAGEGEPFYGEDYCTDQPLKFRLAEIIREQVINRVYDELPHTIRVEVEDVQHAGDSYMYPKSNPTQERVWIRAFIIVKRESQKGIVVGKGGEMIKAIRQGARKEMRRIYNWQIVLDLYVKVE